MARGRGDESEAVLVPSGEVFIFWYKVKGLQTTSPHVDAVIGNSSSGIAEAPSFKIATVNIGDRQKNRIYAKSIINCKPECDKILSSISKIYTKKFKKILKSVKNPYKMSEKRLPSKIAVEIFKRANLNNILKKNFRDISF